MASIDAEAQKSGTTRSEIVRRRLTTAAPPVTETWPAALEILEGAWAGAGPAVRLSYGNPHKQRILDAIRRKKQHRR